MLRWILPAIFSGLAALVVCFPMKWAAGFVLPETLKTLAPDLEMHGTIWHGTVSGLPVIGTANLNIRPLTRRVEIQSGQGRNYLAGQLSSSEAKDINFRVDFASVPFTDSRLTGLQGHVSAMISDMQFSGQSCQSATGTAQTDALQRNGGTIQWTGPELTGPVRCEDGAVIIDFSGRDNDQTIAALIRLTPDGTYRADITVRTLRQEADAVLPLFGFSRSGQNFVLTEQGKWR